jgi:hypothetical protein
MNKQPVFYMQTDAKWKDKPYRVTGESSTIGSAGCGPSCAAMLVETITGKKFTPEDACNWSMKHGYKALNQGTYFAYFEAQFKEFGIDCKILNWTSVYGDSNSSVHTDAFNMLKQGYYLIACMGPGTWTKGGHFVVAWGEDGKVRVNDPNSTSDERSNGDIKTFKSQVKHYWAVDAREYNKSSTASKGGNSMSKYVINTFPQDKFCFGMYHNTGKKTWQKIKQETGCYGLINTAWFSLTKYTIDSQTMIDGKWLNSSEWNGYGLCINDEGYMTVGKSWNATKDYTVALPACYIDGKKHSTYEDKPKNGVSFVGTKKNGDVVCLISSKDDGMTTAEVCKVMLNEGCINILRFDGSWSSQGSLGDGLDVDPSQERKAAIYLLIFKKGANGKPEKIQSNSSYNQTTTVKNDTTKIQTIQTVLNVKYSAGLVVDGKWGPASKKAIIKGIQTEINKLYNGKLVVDGVWGNGSKSACPAIKNLTRNNLAWLIQACLVVKGYDVELDSAYGPSCATAIKDFQKKNSLAADGICGANTFTKLVA